MDKWNKNTGTMPVHGDQKVIVRDTSGLIWDGRAGDFWWHDDGNVMCHVAEWRLDNSPQEHPPT